MGLAYIHPFTGFTRRTGVLQEPPPEHVIRFRQSRSSCASGEVGMLDSVEPRIRRLVAEHLGVGPEELAPEVSLTDDFAADSLDLLELFLALEGQFGIVIPESVIDATHLYGDLVNVIEVLLARRDEPEASELPMVWAKVVPASGGLDRILERAGALTPYTAQVIADDALPAGPGAHLQMSVPTDTSDVPLSHLTDDFAWLERKGVQVSVRRARAVASPASTVHPDAA